MVYSFIEWLDRRRVLAISVLNSTVLLTLAVLLGIVGSEPGAVQADVSQVGPGPSPRNARALARAAPAPRSALESARAAPPDGDRGAGADGRGPRRMRLASGAAESPGTRVARGLAREETAMPRGSAFRASPRAFQPRDAGLAPADDAAERPAPLEPGEESGFLSGVPPPGPIEGVEDDAFTR